MKNKKTIVAGTILALVATIGLVSASDTFSGKGNRGETRLNDLVEENKITQEQKEAISAKRVEFRAEMQTVPTEERDAVRTEHRAEMKEYMESQGVDTSLFPQNGPRAGKGMGGSGQGHRNFVDADGDGTCDNSR
jgi:Spy/CpxP family protein refolding chaperone